MMPSEPTIDSRRPALEPVLAAVGVALLGAVSLSPNGATRVLLWPWWAGWRLLLAVPLALLALAAFRKPGLALPRIPGLLVLAVAAVTLAAALGSEHPRQSLDAAFTPVSAAALAVFLAGRLRGNDRAAGQLAAGIGLAAVAFFVVSLVTWIDGQLIPALRRIGELNAAAGDGVFRLDPHGVRNDRPLGHSNYTAGVTLLTLPWLIGAAVNASGRRRVLWLGALLLGLAVLASTGSRGAVLGIGAGALFAIAHAARARRWPVRRVAAFGVLAAGLAAAFALGVPRTRQSIMDVAAGRGMNTGDRERAAMAQVALAMGAERWWIGQGPGLVPRLYPRYRHGVEGGVARPLQLHTTPLQIWADLGLPGILAAGALLGWALGTALRRQGEGGPAPGVSWEWAAGLSVAAYAGMALTDYQLDVPLVAALAATNLAVLARSRPCFGSPVAGWTAGGLAAGGLLALTALSSPEARARSLLAHAVEGLEQTGDLEGFGEAIEEAAGLERDAPQYHTAAAAACLRLAFSGDDRNPHGAYLTAARRHLQQALAVEPDLEFAHFNLGWLMLDEDPAAAAGHARAAFHLVPDRRGVLVALGLARLGMGDTGRALEAFALRILDNPVYATSPAWDTPLLAPYREPAMARAIALAPEFAPTSRPTAAILRWLLTGAPGAPPPANLDPHPGPVVVGRSTSGIGALRAALAEPGRRREILGRYILLRTTRPATAAELAVLERLLDRLGDDWRAWILAPEGRAPPFLRTYRSERPAFAMLAGNMDVPVPVDAYVVQENGLVDLFFGHVFPPRGNLPDPLLVQHVTSRDL